MKTSRIDWAKFISEEAKVSPLLKSDEIARRFGMSELVVRRSLLRLVKRGLIEHFAKKWFINLLARDFSGRELVNLLRPRSYVSLQTVLREAGISSQTPVSITCVTTGAPASFSSRMLSITFRHIKRYPEADANLAPACPPTVARPELVEGPCRQRAAEFADNAPNPLFRNI
jgi:DNA-binding Lrp family transcriptional regulator